MTPTQGRQRVAAGMLGEAHAMTWLIDHGWEVFVGFGNTSCDFVALKDGVVKRVEVKYATVAPGKRPIITFRPGGEALFDMLLIVCSDGRILVDPGPSEAFGLSRLADLRTPTQEGASA